jgi:hypothetical protein
MLAETLRLYMAVKFKKKQDRQCRYNVTLRREAFLQSLLRWTSYNYYIF